MLEFKKKRVTISDYSLVEFSIEISNLGFTSREFIESYYHIQLLTLK
jgi:hypothetical protein